MEAGQGRTEVPARGRSWVSVAAAVVVTIMLVRLAFAEGGYFPPDFLQVGVFAFAALAVLLVVDRTRPPLSDEALIAVLGIVGLAVWTGLSSTWSALPDEAVLSFERAVVYVGLFGLAVVAAGSGRAGDLLLWGGLTVCTVVVGAAVLSRVRPDWVADGGPSGLDVYRLSWPLGYWNALGALAAMGGVLALGMASSPSRRPELRGICASAAVVLFTGLYLSLSRGAWLALIAGVLVLIVLSSKRNTLLVVSAVVAGAVLLAILRIDSLPALIDDPKLEEGQEAAGREFFGLLVLLTLGAGVAIALIARAGRMEPELNSLKRILRPVVLVLAGLATFLAMMAYVVKADAIEGHTAAAIEDASSWLDRQWEDFLNASAAPTTTGRARLSSSKGTRSDLYRVAIDGFQANPLRGDGAGAFEARWLRERDIDNDEVEDAHSLGLETLGELGLVGALLLLTFIGAILTAIVRARLRPGALRRADAAAAGAAFTVWTAHSMVDWDWQMPVVTATALLVAASCLPLGRTRRRRSDRERIQALG